MALVLAGVGACLFIWQCRWRQGQAPAGALAEFEDPGRRTKTCPECAETVLAAARRCRYCGHTFE